MRKLSRRARRGQAAALAAFRWQPVHRNGIRGQSDPRGAQWRLSAKYCRQSEALRPCRPLPGYSRTMRSRQSSPISGPPGATGVLRSAPATPIGSARHRSIEAAVINSDLPNPSVPDEQTVNRVVAAGPRGALVLAGIATTFVLAIWLAFYIFVFLLRGPLQ